MGKSIDFNKVMEDTKKWFNDMAIKVKNMFNKSKDQTNQIEKSDSQLTSPKKKYNFNDMMNDVKLWFQNFPENMNKLIDKIKNYPPDKQAAVGSIATGTLLVIIALVLFII